MKSFLILVTVLFGTLASAGALTDREIQGLIDSAIKAGGGEVVIPPGTHLITRGLMVKDAKKLRIKGADAEGTILQLPPLVFAEVGPAATAGDTNLTTTRAQGLVPGMQIQIEADGEVDSFTKKPKPYQRAVVEKIDGVRLMLKEPLKFPVPAGTLIRDPQAPNLIEIRGVSDGVMIEQLTLDGGKRAGDPPVRGHAQLCGIFAQGPYSYERGPTGPLVKDVTVARCVIRNCHGRGVAFYAVEGSRVEDCQVLDTTDEAVDLDHFTVRTTVLRNRVERCLIGVELNDASDCVVSGNEFRECRIGINLWRWCRQPGLNEGNQITGNVFERTTGNAVQIGKETAKNIISGNDIRDSGRNGISVAGSAQVVTGNKITGSKLKDIVEAEPGTIVKPAAAKFTPP